MSTIDVRTGITVNYEITGTGEPLLLIMGTTGSLPLWGDLVQRLSRTHQVIAFDNRGMGGTTRGEGPISVRSMADDAAALLEALEIERAHAVGWSLGSAIAQELALTYPSRISTAVLYATWGGCDGFQRALLTALRYPYIQRDMLTASGVGGLAFSPEMLDRPDLAELLEPLLAGFPQNEEQMQVTVEQWDADLEFTSLDRLHAVETPSIVIVGEQDLLTPPRQAKKVAEAIPGAEYHLLTGPHSSHALHLERPDELVDAITAFLSQHPQEG